MEKMNFSVITTVFNEAKSIEGLLDSLSRQTLKPAEIVISDADSTDNTGEKINRWKEKHKELLVNCIKLSKVNRSVGRNRAIEAANYKHIAVIDAGCLASEDWLNTMAEVFSNTGADTVAGFYLTQPTTSWQQVYALYLATQPDQFDPATYLPSSRSLAFTKKAWETVGKYPEKLNTCEDLVFARELKQKTKLMATDQAYVYWQLPETLSQFFKAVAGYAKGDVEARYQPHLVKMATIYGRYLLFILWPWLFLVYLLYPQFKFIRKLPLKALLLSSIVQVVSDLAVMWGGIKGIFSNSS